MFIKITLLAFLAASVHASGGYSSFSYGVSDPITGDVKDQHEKRVGDKVVGQYSLLESDGSKRIVDYSANPHTGFNAVVRKDAGVHPISAAFGGYAGGYGGGYGLNAYAPAAPISYAAAPVPAVHSPAVTAYSNIVTHPAYGAYAHGAYPDYSGYKGYSGYNGYSGYSSHSPVGYNGYSSGHAGYGSLYNGYGAGYAAAGLGLGHGGYGHAGYGHAW